MSNRSLMTRMGPGTWLAVALLVAMTPFMGAAEQAARPDTSAPAGALAAGDAWQRTVELVTEGKFEAAASTVRRVSGADPLVGRVDEWLAEYEQRQAERAQLDQEDLEKYTRYAQRRIEREEYREALDWAWSASDVAPDQEAFLAQPWVQELEKAALAKVQAARAEGDWEKTLELVARLSRLEERNLRYRDLQREAVNHLRLEAMFDGEENYDWREHLKGVRWSDAEDALRYLNIYYVEPPDFQELAASGLEQILLLTESKTAREEFPRLGDELDRTDFVNRVKYHLDRLRDMDKVDQNEVVDTFRRVVKTINPQTVDLPEELVVSELMYGTFDPLDAPTTIFWPKDSEEFQKHTDGQFIGVGISIIKNIANEIEVVSPLDDTPAYRAGIQAGDIVVGVNDQDVKGLSLTKVVDIITGPVDSDVTLTVRRGSKNLEFSLKRARVKIQSVKGYVRDDDERWNHWIDPDNRIGYVAIADFQKNTPGDVLRTVQRMQSEGLRGLIIDLRGNPGGLLTAAYDIAARFLHAGDEVVSTRGRVRAEDQRLRVPVNGEFTDIPVVVLVDGGSASASEIVAGALRDNGRGIVVGERTFGKFSVQNLIPLNRASGASLKVTTARYYLPSGVSLHRDDDAVTWGVEPDIPVKLVRAERVNVYRVRRDRDRLGPPAPKEVDDEGNEIKPSEADDAETDEAGDGAAPQAEAGGDKADDGKADADAQETEAEKLPPLDEPDENNRPKVDPQMQTALLVMRVMLLGERFPTLADAQTGAAGLALRDDSKPVTTSP